MNDLQPVIEVAVVGGGPAGLRAAEVAARAGCQVTVFDAMPSMGRKFLVAGKGGLNLTHDEAADGFAGRYSGPDQAPDLWPGLLSDFGAKALRRWAADLGIETFRATSGRIYPVSLKAAPLLRRWLSHLRHLGVRFAPNHRWVDLTPGSPHELHFADGATVRASTVIFALGGGSWPRTGSDGTWVDRFERLGIACHRLVPANCGWIHPWSDQVLAAAEGKALKNLLVSAGEERVHGELLITRYGLEGGAIYQLGKHLRAMAHPAIRIDFKPSFTEAQLVKKMESVRRDFLDAAVTRWRLSQAAHAMLNCQPWSDAHALAHAVKHWTISLDGPRPLAEAISSAGGVRWKELNSALMVGSIPGVFVAGEMIDWEAPTGGYLLQGCFATGTRAGQAAAAMILPPCPTLGTLSPSSARQ